MRKKIWPVLVIVPLMFLLLFVGVAGARTTNAPAQAVEIIRSILLNVVVESGEVEITNDQITVDVANAALPIAGTVEISNPVTDVEINNEALNVQVLNESIPVSGSVTIDNESIEVTGEVSLADGSLTVTGPLDIGNLPIVTEQLRGTPSKGQEAIQTVNGRLLTAQKQSEDGWGWEFLGSNYLHTLEAGESVRYRFDVTSHGQVHLWVWASGEGTMQVHHWLVFPDGNNFVAIDEATMILTGQTGIVNTYPALGNYLMITFTAGSGSALNVRPAAKGIN